MAVTRTGIAGEVKPAGRLARRGGRGVRIGRLRGHPALTPAPFPNGWYALAFSRELRRGDLLNVRFMGQEMVLFRTAEARSR
jgi:hypothetical protein